MYLQGVGQAEDELEGEGGLADGQETEAAGQAQEHRDAHGVLEALGDLLRAGRLHHLQETAHDQDKGHQVVEQDQTDGEEKEDEQRQAGLQEAASVRERNT